MRLRRVVAVARPCNLAKSERSTTRTSSIAAAAGSPTISLRAERTPCGTATARPRNARMRIQYPVISETAVALRAASLAFRASPALADSTSQGLPSAETIAGAAQFDPPKLVQYAAKLAR